MNGIIVIDKPKDFTSFDVIAKLRGILKQRKLGHGGTLDPMATGVLPVFAGSATKAVDLIPCVQKRYTASVKLGIKTDTGDVTGQVIEHSENVCDREQLLAAMELFTGGIKQVPPMYSAIQIGGQRLYKLARQGKTVDRPARAVTIFKMNLLDFSGEQKTFVIDVRCSGGTYIRTLVEDIAREAGCLATLSSLQRTESAGFSIGDCVSIEDVEQAAKDGSLDKIIIPTERIFDCCDRIGLDEIQTRKFLNGVVFDVGKKDTQNVTFSVYSDKTFLGLAAIENGRLKKIKQFYFSDSGEAE